MSTAASHITSSGSADPERARMGYDLARYTVSDRERILVGVRIDREAVLIDVPADDQGRVYLVERNLDRDGGRALWALIADYVRVAEALDRVPMARAETSWSRG